jgi:hypothetical protein
MTFNEFYEIYQRALSTNTYPDWRKGQTLYNLLSFNHPVLAKQILGSELDPYYTDENLKVCLAFLAYNWEKPTVYQETGGC